MKQIFKSFITLISLLLLCLVSCQKAPTYPELKPWETYDEKVRVDSSQQNENQRLRYKRIQSLTLDRDKIMETIKVQLEDFTAEKYEELRPLVYDKSIEALQTSIDEGKLTYKLLTQWYLYRIAITESDKNLSVNAIISINPYAVTKAEYLDSGREDKMHPIFGMPILLKDNINTKDMPTTAGAMALQYNYTASDAFIVENLKSKGAIILGKANLSEWANFLCAGCPNGYSAIGGQTLNPYGRRKFDTGGSSSGSAAAVAANYAVGAVGTETSGSILSPASQQALVGLKPTVDKKHQEGIIPISGTLDTPGPMTRNVSDNQILYSAMFDLDMMRRESTAEQGSSFKLGAIKSFMSDSLYKASVKLLKDNGVEVVIVEPQQMDFGGFLALLNGDMKRDLASYLKKYTEDSISVKSVADVVKFNVQDSLMNIPYGQARLDGIVEQELEDTELDSIRQKLIASGKAYFDFMIDQNELDAVLSINNYNAGQAAVAMYPAITVPMGSRATGEPVGLTFISKSNQEQQLYELALFFESIF
jgi:amidase